MKIHVAWPLLVTVLLLGSLGGCASAPERELSRQSIPYAALPNGHDPLHPERLVAGISGKAGAAEEGVIPALERLRGHPLNILELSGGGQYGAFGAGFLKGWTESGQRPELDIVTGVSTGALLATHAFLGTPGDDATLEEIFTTISSENIYTDKRVLSLLWGRKAVYDTSPLRALLDRYITAEVLRRVAAAHDEHRRLWVGTTNLDYGQTWIWNMGMIAEQATPEALELYKNVLRASAAPPIVFPAVEISGHLFGDGGVRENLVVVGLAGKHKPGPPRYAPGTVFVVQNGQQARTPKAVRNDALHLAGPVLGAMMSNSTDGMLVRAYTAAKIRGYRFRLISIPDDADVGHDFLAFDPGQMRAAFEIGYQLGRSDDPWKRAPPLLQDMPSWLLDISAGEP